MPKTRQQKEKLLSDFVNSLDTAKSVVVSSFAGISIKEDQELRKSLREKDVSYQVIKKTLLSKAINQKGWEEFDLSAASGNVAVAISQSDEVAPAKELHAFAKDKDGVTLVAGAMMHEGNAEILDKAGVEALALIPSREELVAKVVGSIGAPLSGLVGVLQGNIRGFVHTLKAIEENKS